MACTIWTKLAQAHFHILGSCIHMLGSQTVRAQSAQGYGTKVGALKGKFGHMHNRRYRIFTIYAIYALLNRCKSNTDTSCIVCWDTTSTHIHTIYSCNFNIIIFIPTFSSPAPHMQLTYHVLMQLCIFKAKEYVWVRVRVHLLLESQEPPRAPQHLPLCIDERRASTTYG